MASTGKRAKKTKTAPELDIYLNALKLGRLDFRAQRGQKLLQFQYDESWLSRASAFPISRSLPLKEEAYLGEEVFSYFDNLLPDTVSIRQRMAARLAAESDHVFDLLKVVGRDCVGALQFMSPEDEAPKVVKPEGTAISRAQIGEKLRGLKSSPLGVSNEEDFRLSLAGAQEKTALLKLRGKWYVPHGSVPTTHIIKPQLGQMGTGLNFADSVENEWLCAQITNAFGLPTTECEIAEFDGVKVLVVERFDRAQLDDGRLIRVPQEDFCQALAIPGFQKYENEGGPGITRIMDVLNESSMSEQDRRFFMKTQIVFILLAAIDGHAKNFSLRWAPDGFAMTPLYDVISAQPLVDRGELAIQKLKMAMAYGQSRHYKLRELNRRHLLQSAKLCRFSQVAMEELIDETLAQTSDVIKRVQTTLPKGFPAETADSIFKGMKSRVQMLKA